MLTGSTPFWDRDEPLAVYENILKCRVKYPPYFHPDAENLLKALIVADPSQRLCGLKGDVAPIKGHKWFSEINWDEILKKEVEASYVPPIKPGCGDISQFDKYSESDEEDGDADGER
jgi:protein kinase A